MNKQEQIKIVSISYLISIGATFIISYLKSSSLNVNDILSAIRISTILTVWWGFYFNIGWKIKGLNKILYRINLNGTWYGTYKSSNMDTDEIYEGEIMIRIKQSFLALSINSYTDKYVNYSHSEVLKYDEKSGTHGLVYVYSQKENDPLDLNARNGTAELRVSEEEGYILKGDFWTILGSKGLLNVTRVSNEHTSSFNKGKKLYEEYNRHKEGAI